MTIEDYVRSPLGMLNIAAVLVNTCAILTCGLQWSNGVFLQILFIDHGWLSLAEFFLIGATIVVIAVFIFYCCPLPDAQTRLTGGGFVFLLCIALLLELFCGVIVVWYLMVEDRNGTFYLRYILILVLVVMFLLLVMFMILLANKYLTRVWAIENEPVPPGQFAHKITTPNGSHHTIHVQETAHHQNHQQRI